MCTPFSAFWYKCYLSTVSKCLSLWIINIMPKRPPYGPGNGRGSLGVKHKPSCCHYICRLGHVFESGFKFFFLSVGCKQGGNHGTEVGIHHCLCIWGVYLYLRFYVRSFRCCFWFHSPTSILFIEELGDVVKFFSYICKCGPFFSYAADSGPY
jgi:hypothetical protein